MKKPIIIIAAIAHKTRIIGVNQKLPWSKQRADMQHFKETTTGAIVIMGRKTFASMDCKPLPNRINIVVSTTLPAQMVNENLFYCDSVDAAIELSNTLTAEKQEIYCIGGGKLYADTFDMADTLILTEIFMPTHRTPVGTVTVFPYILDKFWYMDSLGEMQPEDERNEYKYRFITYKRRVTPYRARIVNNQSII